MFPSLKAGLVGVTRYWHADLPLLLDADPDVVSFTAETTKVTFEFEGEERVFRPDVQVDYRRSRQGVIALLREDEAILPENVAAAQVLRSFYAERGMDFRVITDQTLRVQPRLDNAQTFFRHRHLPVSMEHSMRLAKAVAEGRADTLGGLHGALGGDEAAWSTLLALAAHGCIEVDLDEPLEAASPVLRVVGKGGLA
ncbi:hypothetical protein ACJ41P_24495 [Azospirillum argentinense]|uniref:TnsA endonuclease N-terminal domain-containing protein n=1 Tax=Azospirillum argentinense TaxID=2970906 RepID=A0ABW8VCX6_9PROT